MPSATRSLASKRFLRAERGVSTSSGFLVRGEAFGRFPRPRGRLAPRRTCVVQGKKIGVSPRARVRVADTSSGGRFCERNRAGDGDVGAAGARSPRARADRHARRSVFVRRYAFSAPVREPAKRDQAVARRGRFGEILAVTSGLRLHLCWLTPPPARDDVGGASACCVHHPRR